MDHVIWEMPAAQTFAVLAIIQQMNNIDKKGKWRPIQDHIEQEVTRRLLKTLQENRK